jgi:tetratricopeptide (TPR) repeat protein
MDSARLHMERGEHERSLALFAEAVAERRALLAEEPTQARTQRDLAVALLLSSEAQSKAGKHADAIREATESVDLMSKLTAQEAQSSRPDARNITTLGNCRSGVAAADFAAAESSADRAGSLEAARRSWNAAAELFAERLAADPENADLKQFLADARGGAGACLQRLGRHSEALDAAAQAVGIFRERVSASPNDLWQKRTLALNLRRLADAHAALAADPQRAADDRRRSREAALLALSEAITLAQAVAESELKPIDESASIESLRQALAAVRSAG